MKKLSMKGLWQGYLYQEKPWELVEGEMFQIEVLEIDRENRIRAIIWEEDEAWGLKPSGRLRTQGQPATGSINPFNGEFTLHYEITGRESQPGFVVLKGRFYMEERFIEGKYSYYLKGTEVLDMGGPHSKADIAIHMEMEFILKPPG